MRRGLTLVELLVTLTILVALTTVAVEATDRKLRQSRFETSARQLGELERAVVGERGVLQPDRTLLVQGFAADLGRLPAAVGADPETQLAELWAQGALAPFALRAASVDPDVVLGVGWRGPYLRLPLGAEGLRDGWGNPLGLRSGGAAAADGDPIDAALSLGENAREDALDDGYDQDLTVLLSVGSSVRVRIGRDDDGDGVLEAPQLGDGTNLFVAYFGPSASGDDVVAVRHSAGPNDATIDGVAIPTLLFDATQNVTAGPRVVRAYQTSEATFAEALDDSDGIVSTKSRVLELVLPPAGLAQTKDLVFP